MIRSLLLLLFLVFAAPLAAQPGALDQTFAAGGTYSYDAPNTGATRVVVRPDGRVLVIGIVQGEVAVLSLLPDGSVDTAFGTSGLATFPGSDGYVPVGTALLGDGSLVLSGARQDDDDVIEAAALLKLTASGAPEASFGTDGIATFEAEDGFGGTLFAAVRALPGGGLASGGTYETDGGSGVGFVTARFTETGALDATFGTDGVVRVPSTFGLAALGGSFDASGALLLTGGVSAGGFLDLDAAIARVLADGTTDQSFGTDGFVSFGTGQPFSLVTDATADAQGRTLGVGAAIDFFGGVSEAFVFRLLPDGSLDPDFASGGLFSTTAGAAVAQSSTIALQSDGKVVFSGTAGTFDAPDVLIGRLTASGEPDATFGTDGFARVSFGAASVGTDLALQPDGRIVVVGQRGDGESDPLGMVVARLQNDDVDTAAEAPARSGPLALSLAGPNPFARGTALALDVAEPLAVRVAAYDVLGREVAVLHDGPLAAGQTVLAFEGSALAPGTYLVRARSGAAAAAALGVVRR